MKASFRCFQRVSKGNTGLKWVNQFLPNAAFLYPLENIRKPNGFLTGSNKNVTWAINESVRSNKNMLTAFKMNHKGISKTSFEIVKVPLLLHFHA